MLGSTNNLSRGSPARSSEIPPLPQCLPLEPIKLGNQKYTRSGDLRKVLGVAMGSISEDNSFGALHLRPAPPVATEDIKHIKEGVQDTRKLARDRVQQLSESIVKLDKYSEVLSTKKRQRSDILSSDRSGGASLSKIGSQILRNPHVLITQRLEDKTKGVPLNKRARTSVTDMRADGRSGGASSKLLMATDKDGDIPSAVSGEQQPARIEEKIRRLPAGGEGPWDTKKRKRSVGAIGNRAMAVDRDIKRSIMQPKLSADPKKWRSGDPQGFRLKSSSPGGVHKLDGAIEPARSDASLIHKNELESSSSAERTTTSEHRTKGSNKPNMQDGDTARNPSTILKAKVSRGPRSNSMIVLDSSSCRAQPLSGSPQAWEQPSTLNKVSLIGATTNNQKRSTTVGPSLHSMQWVGQRPHKNSRTRRTNLISPVSSHEAQTPSPSFGASDLTAKSSLLGNGENCTPKMMKRELDNVSSPFSFSESEESGAGDNKLKVGAFGMPIRKNKISGYEIGDGVRKQERSSLTRPGMILPVREKLENLPTGKPIGSVRTASDKMKSKSGRPPYKKLKDRKPSNRMSLILGGSTEFTGESGDDREELSVAAKSARNASNLACSGPFWKKVESVFSSVSPEDVSYFKKQLSFAEELDESFSQMLSFNNDPMKEAADKSVGLAKSTPLYQRVLSALIEEDESEEINHLSEGKNLVLQYSSDDSHCGSCNLIDIETKDRDRMESEIESESDLRSQNHYFLDRNSSEKSVASIITYKNPSMSSSLLSNEHWSGDEVLSHSSIVSEICSDEPREMHGQIFSSSDSQYELMCFDDRLMLELQSIGLFPEALPDLAEEEVINEDVTELTENLYQQVGKTKMSLGKIDRAIQEVRQAEKRRVENAAMDELLVMAYRKRMACRGSNSTKSGVRKVSRHVALGFIKRTLARCRKLEATGNSCFSEDSLQDILFSVPQSVDGVGSGTASNTCNEARGSDALQAANSSEHTYPKNGSSLNKLKKREVLIDDVVGSASSRITSTLDNTVTGARGKRDQKTKAKAKPKNNNNNQLSTSTTHPTGPARSSSHPTGNNANRKISEAEELMDLESLEDLGAFLQFDEEALQELPMDDGLDGLCGYDIPLDDFNLILKG